MISGQNWFGKSKVRKEAFIEIMVKNGSNESFKRTEMGEFGIQKTSAVLALDAQRKVERLAQGVVHKVTRF